MRSYANRCILAICSRICLQIVPQKRQFHVHDAILSKLHPKIAFLRLSICVTNWRTEGRTDRRTKKKRNENASNKSSQIKSSDAFWWSACILVLSFQWHSLMFLMLFFLNSADISETQLLCDQLTDGRTDGPIDFGATRPTDRPTDTP